MGTIEQVKAEIREFDERFGQMLYGASPETADAEVEVLVEDWFRPQGEYFLSR